MIYVVGVGSMQSEVLAWLELLSAIKICLFGTDVYRFRD